MRLRIITFDGVVFSGDVEMVITPTQIGEIGILPHHTPLLSKLKKGRLRVKKEGKEDYYLINEGILEVCEDKISILTQEATLID